MIVTLPRSKPNGLLNVFGTEGDERNNVSEIRNLKKRQRRIAFSPLFREKSLTDRLPVLLLRSLLPVPESGGTLQSNGIRQTHQMYSWCVIRLHQFTHLSHLTVLRGHQFLQHKEDFVEFRALG